MEWNESVIGIIFIVLLIPTLFVYFIVKWIITFFSSIDLFIDDAKKRQILVYGIIQIGILAVSVGLTLGLLSLIVFIKGGGLLE